MATHATMHAAQKAKLEQRIVMGLLAVFTIAFVMGPARTLGWFRPPLRRAPSAVVEQAPSVPSIPALVQQYNDKINSQVESKPSMATSASVSAVQATYAAQTVRDPLKSLLPPPAEKPNGAARAGQPALAEKPQPQKPPPPPALKVQGCLWGGSAPKAIIDGRLYGVGESIQGVKILSIDRSGVVVDHHGTTVLYTIPVVSDKAPGSRGR